MTFGLSYLNIFFSFKNRRISSLGDSPCSFVNCQSANFLPRKNVKQLKEFLLIIFAKCLHVRGIRAIMTSSFCRDFINVSLQKKVKFSHVLKHRDYESMRFRSKN